MARLSIALTGDTILQRRVSTYDDPAFLAALDVVRGATTGFTNVEGCIQTGEDWHALVAGNGRAATFIRTPPFVVDELAWMGFQLLSMANNHSADFGEGGVLTTLRHLSRRGDLVPAGLGATLAEAAAPRYLDTAAGVVALIAAADWGPRGIGDLPFPAPMGALAADADRYFKGRPGLNLLRYDCTFTVPEEQFAQLRHISQQMGWDASKAMRRGGGGRAEPLSSPSPAFDEDECDGSLSFQGRRFVAGDGYTFTTDAYAGDIDRIVRAVAEARRQADWVVVSLHQQGAGRVRPEATDHTLALGRAVAAAGADVYVAHGAGRAGGIELTGSTAAVYGPGSFVMHLDQVKQLPLEMMRRLGFDYDDEAGEALARRHSNESVVGSEIGLKGVALEAHANAIVVVELERGRAPEVVVHPIELTSASEGRAASGMPRLLAAGSEKAASCLAVLDARSRVFGTEVVESGGVGRARALA